MVDRVQAARRADKPGRVRLIPVKKIGEGERQILHVPALQAECLEGFLFRARKRKLRCEIAQEFQAPFANDALGVFGDDAKHARDASVVVRERTVRKRMIGFFGKAAALQKQKKVLIVGGGSCLEDGVDPRADIRPNLRPDLPRRRAQRPALLDAKRRPVSIIAKESQVLSPGHPHGIAGREQDTDDRFQTLRPSLGRSERGSRPVMAAHKRAHFAAAIQEVCRLV